MCLLLYPALKKYRGCIKLVELVVELEEEKIYIVSILFDLERSFRFQCFKKDMDS